MAELRCCGFASRNQADSEVWAPDSRWTLGVSGVFLLRRIFSVIGVNRDNPVILVYEHDNSRFTANGAVKSESAARSSLEESL